MGEVPIYTCKAHVFLIDPDTKKSWVPASRTAVPVNFFYDSARRSYRIISVDGTKAIINSTMMPEMVFTKTSAKFGQWADIRAGTVYGLGFNTDSLLNKFLENFNDIRDRAVELKGQVEMKEVECSETMRDGAEETGASKPHVNFRTSKDVVLATGSTPTKKPPMSLPNGAGTPSAPTPTLIEHHSHHHSSHHHDHPASLVDDQRSEATNAAVVGGGEAKLSSHCSASAISNAAAASSSSATAEIKNLRHQNERLRQALAQSNANSKKWETEMTTLKTTNSRLTTALQESMTSVDQWHRQLATYKEENDKLKRKLGEAEHKHKHESEGASEQMEHIRRQMEQLQVEAGDKASECSVLQQRISRLACYEHKHNEANLKLKKSQEECGQLKARLQAFEERVGALTRERNQRQRLTSNLLSRLAECSDIVQQLSQPTGN